MRQRDRETETLRQRQRQRERTRDRARARDRDREPEPEPDIIGKEYRYTQTHDLVVQKATDIDVQSLIRSVQVGAETLTQRRGRRTSDRDRARARNLDKPETET